MTEPEQEPLSDEDLAQADGEPLPDREEMSMMPMPDPLGGITLPVEPPVES
jgi:hypothetical protein